MICCFLLHDGFKVDLYDSLVERNYKKSVANSNTFFIIDDF